MSYIQKETLKTYWRAILNTNDFHVIKLAEDLMNGKADVDSNDSLNAMMEVESSEEEALHKEQIEDYSVDDLPF